MDPVQEIKMRLTIEEVVGWYCQLQKKGRNLVCLCPFHNDKNPSFLVSPDKGIAYCFACRNGGDIFSFYQSIEAVDFPQALKDLAERAGVRLEKHATVKIEKNERERLRECLEAAQRFYQTQFASSMLAQEYVRSRGVTAELLERFGIGFAPDSFSATYEHLLKEGFSRKELLGAGIGVQRELQEERIYDRFRNRLMFPISDHQGNLVAFGGRTLGEDDAKYINSSEGPLYRKSSILFGLAQAKEAIRKQRRVILVEGYFDVIACHQVGIEHAVAQCGTALTEQHAKLLKRYADTVILCLDQDQAGRAAAERAFTMLAKEGLAVHSVILTDKDPGEAAVRDPALLKQLLSDGGVPYLDAVLQEISGLDLSNAAVRRDALARLLPLLAAIPSTVERERALADTAKMLRTSPVSLEDDLRREQLRLGGRERQSGSDLPSGGDLFSKSELTLGLFLLFPRLRTMLPELIAPEDEMPSALYEAMKSLQADHDFSIDQSSLTPEHRERVRILQLYCEQHGFADWGESLAVREIRRNCQSANREMLQRKKQELSKKLLEAQRAGKSAEAALLTTQYQQMLKLEHATSKI